MKTISRTVTHIPAQSGWFITEPIGFAIHYNSKNPRDWAPISIHYEPIIAWEIETHEIELSDSPEIESNTTKSSSVVPITAEGAGFNTDYGIKRPDGSLVVPGDMEIEDEQDMKDYFIDLRYKRMQREKKLNAPEKLTLREFAKKTALSIQAVDALIRRGVLEKGKDGLIGSEEAIKRISAHARCGKAKT